MNVALNKYKTKLNEIGIISLAETVMRKQFS